MNRHQVDKRKLDPVAEVLKDLSAGKTVTKAKAEGALTYYNHVVAKAKEDERTVERNHKVLQENAAEITNLKSQLKEQSLRLSKLAGDKMAQDNPDLADLSDPFRPTKLVESFRQVYDDEWTHAFEDLQAAKIPERLIIDSLAAILMDAETFCEEAANQQIHNMLRDNTYVLDQLTQPKYKSETMGDDPMTSKNAYELNHKEEEIIKAHIKQLRKTLARTSVRGLTEIFAKCFLSKRVKPGLDPSDGIDSFVKKTIELVWMMKIQDTPMVMFWARQNNKFDRNTCSEYTRKGDIIDYAIWPGILLHKDGPLVSKGIVQCKIK